jgi:hypothetical protein
MITEAELPAASSRLDPDAMIAVALEAGMVPPAEHEISVARALAGDLMQHEVVSVETLMAVRAIQPAAMLVFKEQDQITGVFGQLLLRPSAVRSIFAGDFDALDVDIDHLSRPGELATLGYAWGLAASTKRGAGAVILHGQLVRARLFPDLTIFTRAVTPVGRHIALNRYRYQPFRHPDDDLLIRLPEGAPPQREPEAVAA